MKMLALIALLFLGSLSVLADETAVEKYGKMTPKEITALPKEELSSSVPIKYHWAAQEGLSFGVDLSYMSALNSLMYPAINDLPASIKEFQRDLGANPTGELTVDQIHTLGERADFQKISHITFPSESFGLIMGDYAYVKGTMVILDEEIAYPINHNELTCTKSNMTCELEQISLHLPELDQFAVAYFVNKSPAETFTVSKWESKVIEAIEDGGEEKCRRISLSLNFATKEYFYITQNGTGDCDLLGATLDKLEKPRIAKFVDGSEIYKTEFEKLRELAYSFLSSSYRSKVEGTIEEWNKKQEREKESSDTND